jgi:hypothetical protein
MSEYHNANLEHMCRKRRYLEKKRIIFLDIYLERAENSFRVGRPTFNPLYARPPET